MVLFRCYDLRLDFYFKLWRLNDEVTSKINLFYGSSKAGPNFGYGRTDLG